MRNVPTVGSLQMAETGAYGKKLGEHLHLDHVPALVSKTIIKAPVAVTRCMLDAPTHGPTSPIPDEDAYMVVLQTGQRSHRELWLDGRSVRTEPLNPGEVALHDLRRRPVFKMYTPIDSLNFYIPRRALDACADDANARRIEELHFTPGIGINDKILALLGSALLPAFEHPDRVSRLFVDHLTLAIVAHLAYSLGGMKDRERPVRGGLALWQERRAKEFIDANLDGDISVMLLARACGLSAKHFARAFRQSTGLAPHQWLLQRRIDKAKRLLCDAQVPLADAALACGFADQSHLTRVFTRAVGLSPGQWRRAHGQ
jgi:AraC family transcriptional regulator